MTTTIAVTPSSVTLAEGAAAQLTATFKDQDGNAVEGGVVTWTTDHPELVTVSATGLAKAAAAFPGGTTVLPAVIITATSGALSATASVTLTRAPGASGFNVWPDTNVVFAGMTRTLQGRLVTSTSGYPGPGITALDANGISWSTSDASVATVNAGVVTAVGPGHARITALYSGATVNAEVYVTAPPATPLRFASISSDVPIVGPGRNDAPLFAPRACGVSTDGSIYCWGATLDSTQVSDRCEVIGPYGVQGARIVRYRCSEIPLRLPTDVKFTSVATIGRVQTAVRGTSRGGAGCGLATTRRVYCWGSNAYGELGIGTTDSAGHGLALISGSDEFIELRSSGSVGSGFCGIRTDGVLRCWGSAFGSLPATVASDKSWRMLADDGKCGLASDSTAYCFGTTAQSVGGATRWKSIGTSSRVTCAVALDDSLYCGSNLQSKQAPAQAVIRLATYRGDAHTDGTGGTSNTCGVTAGGDLRCADAWATVSLPVKLTSFNGICGIATDQKVYCRMSLNSATYTVIRGQE